MGLRFRKKKNAINSESCIVQKSCIDEDYPSLLENHKKCPSNRLDMERLNENYKKYIINDNKMLNKMSKKTKKLLGKVFKSFALNEYLQKSMQSPDWEYYYNKEKNY